MSIAISRLHHPVTSLGYGTRAGIWFQGCTIMCHGCVSRDTWPARESALTTVELVLDWLAGRGEIDGVTISGGEPTDQPEALRALLRGIAALSAGRGTRMDVLLYSGRTTDVIDRTLPWLRGAVDALVTGPYVEELAGVEALRGSANQEVVATSELGVERYGTDAIDPRYAPQRAQMDVEVDGDSIWLVGIPRPGDMPRLREKLAGRGVRIRRTSWLS